MSYLPAGRRPAASLVLIVAGYLLHAAVFGDYVADDAGISLAYARNLAAGYGPVLYPGGAAVEGFSNPLWVALLAIASALRLDGANGVPLLKASGLLLGGAAAVLTVALSGAAYPADVRFRWVAPSLLVASTGFVFWSGAGLENSLYALTLTVAVILYLYELEHRRGAPWSAIALLAVALTRPEGCAFFVAFLVHRLLVAPPLSIRESARLATWIGLFVLGFMAFLLIRRAVFGDWLPNTYYAKVFDRDLSALLQYVRDPEDDGRRYVAVFLRENWAIALAAVIGLLDRRCWRSNSLLAGLFAGTCLYAVFVGGDFWPQGRFFSGALPILAVAAQHGASMVAGSMRGADWIPGAALVFLVAGGSAGASFDLRHRHQEDNLISLQGRLAQGRRVRTLAAAAGVGDPLYVDPDIGGPTLAGLRVLDLGGLADHHIARFDYYPPFFRQYIFVEQRPHYIRTHSSWTRSSRITSYPEFEQQYVAIEEKRDARGRHGLFVRRDLATGAPARSTTASFAQAVRDARAIRAREDRREHDGWIDYYGDREHAKLRRRFEASEASGTLPPDAAVLTELYFGLLSAADGQGAKRVARAAGRAPVTTTLYERGAPVLSLTDWRITRRPEDFVPRLQMFLEALSADAGSYSPSILLIPSQGERHTLDASLTPRFGQSRPHETVEVRKHLWVDPDRYEVRAEFRRHDTGQVLCVDAASKTCYVSLGSHELRR